MLQLGAPHNAESRPQRSDADSADWGRAREPAFLQDSQGTQCSARRGSHRPPGSGGGRTVDCSSRLSGDSE